MSVEFQQVHLSLHDSLTSTTFYERFLLLAQYVYKSITAAWETWIKPRVTSARAAFKTKISQIGK